MNDKIVRPVSSDEVDIMCTGQTKTNRKGEKKDTIRDNNRGTERERERERVAYN